MDEGDRFERRNTFVSPEQQLRNVVRMDLPDIRRYATENSDLLLFELTLKIEEKIDLKDQIDAIWQFRDDITVRQRIKKIGMFVIVEQTAQLDWEEPNSDFSLHKDEPYLDIHIPYVNTAGKSFTNVTESLQQVAQYIQFHNLNPKYILGVTHERLARVSRRQGFTVIEPTLPENTQASVERYYNSLVERGIVQEPIGKILLCFQTREDFLNRYVPQ